MAANPFSRGTSPGRARPPHRGSFVRGHAKRGGRKKKTPNAISPRARKAIAAAAKRVPRGTTLNRNHWQWAIEKNPLINEARERQGQFTLTGAVSKPQIQHEVILSRSQRGGHARDTDRPIRR